MSISRSRYPEVVRRLEGMSPHERTKYIIESMERLENVTSQKVVPIRETDALADSLRFSQTL